MKEETKQEIIREWERWRSIWLRPDAGVGDEIDRYLAGKKSSD